MLGVAQVKAAHVEKTKAVEKMQEDIKSQVKSIETMVSHHVIVEVLFPVLALARSNTVSSTSPHSKLNAC